MVIKVGINSFGRIGRVIFRTCCENSEIKVSAINDPAIDLEYMCYLIKFDSSLGKFPGNVSYEGDEIKINDHTVKVFRQKAPADIPWHEAGVQYVVEASGMFTNVEKASGHLTSDSVRRVVVTGPSADAPMLILGVNENTIKTDMKVISCASSTLYCLAPIVKILEEAYGVADGCVTSIHAMTPSLKPLDGLCGRGKHWRDHRSIHQNIIPAMTGACRALGRVVPSCRDKLAGLAFRVPVVHGSVLDVTVRLNKNTSIAEITKTIEESQNPLLRNIIQVSNEKTVSSDFAGDSRSCILDVSSSLQIKSNFFKLICWYENEYSYSCRVVDTVLFLERQYQAQIDASTRIMYIRPSSNAQNIENSRGDVIRQYVSFCVPNLKNNLSSMKPGLRSFELRPTSVHCSVHHRLQLDQPAFPEGKQSIKSYIDRLTKCQCNAKRNKTDLPKKYSSRDAHAKAENCFKEVEKEISEMLNMAEDFLSKSPSKKLQPAKKPIKTSEIECENRIIMRKNIIAKISETLEKIKKAKMSVQTTSLVGDQKTLDVDDSQDKVNLPPCTANNLNSSYFKMPKSTLPSTTVNSDVNLNTFMNKTCTNYSMSDCTQSKEINNLNHIKLTIKSHHITNDLKSEHSTNRQDDDTRTVATIVSEKLENTLKFLNVTAQGTSQVTDTFLRKYNEVIESNKHNNQSETVIPVNKDLIKIVDSKSDFHVDKKPKPDSIENVHQQSSKLVESASQNDTYEAKYDSIDIQKEDSKYTDDVNNLPGCSISTIENDSEKSLSRFASSCSIPILSRSSTYRNTSDIYDKLDSESMSGSGSSCRIREKASQIINITDLTYSLEDFPRLDKICRVIEISDELSDKLFSPLDNDNCENTTSRKWSFQDMCERIKFDDFCNELFEKPAS